MNSMGTHSHKNTDNASILLKYDNGTNAVINYFANGSKAYSKERIEAYNQEKTLILDNWRILRGYGTKGFSFKRPNWIKVIRTNSGYWWNPFKKGVSLLFPLKKL